VSRLTLIVCAVVICLLVSTTWAINHYRNKAIAFKDQRDKATKNLSVANATITDMQARQQAIADLDAKYTKELADAKNTISDLRRDVDSGAKRLRVSATCPGVRKTTGTASVDDATSPRLTDSSQRDYFTLRERIELVNKQLTGLQEYILKVCR
jgi:prophage endopeptidase